MAGSYSECRKADYEAVGQLMELAKDNKDDKNDKEQAFFKLLEESRNEVLDRRPFDTAAAMGLMNLNKAEMLDKFIHRVCGKEGFFGDIKILCHFGGILLREKRCNEAVKAVAGVICNDFSNTYYILTSAVFTDNIEIFRQVYEGKLSAERTEETKICYESSLLIGGIFKSKKILDYLTCGGSDFLKEKLPFDLDFNKHTVNSLNPPMGIQSLYNKPEDEFNDDILIRWLQNIYDMYFKNETGEKLYDILTSLAANTGIIYDIKNTDDFFYSAKSAKLIMRKIYINVTSGHKTDDLSSFIPSESMLCTGALRFSEILMDIVGENPFVSFDKYNSHICINHISILAEKLKGRLCVKLKSRFGIQDIKTLEGAVMFELDINDPETREYICSLLKPAGKNANPKILREQWELAIFLIENNFAAVDDLTKISSEAGNAEIIKKLYDYECRN